MIENAHLSNRKGEVAVRGHLCLSSQEGRQLVSDLGKPREMFYELISFFYNSYDGRQEEVVSHCLVICT